ncbi:hypothetical protein Zm00014a_029732 [Zea mays]|uniref:Uncharacterized protein n=1 Tax=Zea mays TaxID=4577 RepID=A0A317YAW6_MAIZE|nr:hypothetical protein Zm00014a_029732 [Zea mays]
MKFRTSSCCKIGASISVFFLKHTQELHVISLRRKSSQLSVYF